MYKMEQRIYFEDIDSYGIIHHPRVLYFFERARTSYLREMGFPVESLAYGLFLRQIQIRYKHPLKMHDWVTILQEVKKTEKYKFTLAYHIYCQHRSMVQAEIEFVTVDLKSKKMIPIPDELKNILLNDRMKKMKTEI